MKTVSAIVAEVAAQHGLKPSDLKGTERARVYSHPRQEAYWRAARETRHSLARIGYFIGGRHYTTVAHGIRRHEARLAVQG